MMWEEIFLNNVLKINFKLELYFVQTNNMEEVQLYNKLYQLPSDLKSEVNDFIDFLLTKKR